MTVTQESSMSPLYQGDGSVTAFAFNFKVLSSDHLLVYTYNVDTEDTTLLTKDIDYAVALASGGESGGLVNMVSAPASNEKLRIFRDTPKDQQMNLTNQGNFHPSVLNGSADKAVLVLQEIIDTLERAIILDPMSPETPDDLYNRINDAQEIAVEALGKSNIALADSDTALGQSNTALSNSSTALGQSNTAISNSSTALGQSNTALANSSTALAISDTALGQSGTALSNSSTAIDTANTALATAQSSYAATVEYINTTLAQWFSAQGPWENPIVWTTSVSDGDSVISTPFTFSQGLFFHAGVTYALNDINYVTLDQTQENTRIILHEPVTSDGTGILVVLNTNVPLQATWSGSISAGEDTITTPYEEAELLAGGFIIVGGAVHNLGDCTVSGSDVVLPNAVLASHAVILVLLSS